MDVQETGDNHHTGRVNDAVRSRFGFGNGCHPAAFQQQVQPGLHPVAGIYEQSVFQ